MKHINKKIKALWGISEIGFYVMAYMEITFFFYFLTDVALLPIPVTAAITSISAVADTIAAVVAGIVIDKVRFKAGKYRPWLFYCPPVITVFFVFCFTKIGGDIMAGIIITIGYVMSHFIWTIVWTANNNMISVLTNDPNERSYLSAHLATGASLGKIIASYLVPYLSVAFFAIFSPVTSYTVTAIISCVLFMVCYFIHYAITNGYDTDTRSVEKKTVTFKNMAKSIGKNPHLIAFLLQDVLSMTSYQTMVATAAYYAKVVLEDASVITWMLVMFHAGAAAGSYFSSIVAKKIGAKKTVLAGCIGCAVFMTVCCFLPPHVFLIAPCLFLAQISFGLSYGLRSSLYTMCGTYSIWKTGEDARGVIMSLNSLAGKVGIALRSMLIPAVLAWIVYDPNSVIMTVQAKSSIKLLFLGIPVIIMMLSLIPLALFHLNEKKVVSMEKEIMERKSI